MTGRTISGRTVFAVLVLVTGVLAISISGEALAQGCAMCATYLSANDPRTQAFKTSIIFLMIMPFAVVGSVGGWVAWMHRRHRLRQSVQPVFPMLPALGAEGEGVS